MPFDGGDCGPNLEYDNQFLALQQAALGRPATQFEAGQAPDWPAVEAAALQLLARSRDLRLVAIWLESQIHLHGLSCLPAGFNAIAELLERAWPNLNPPLDEGDPYARLNVIEGFGRGGSFFIGLRNCKVLRHPKIGEVRLKDFEPQSASPESPTPILQLEQLEQFLASPEGRALNLHVLLQQIMDSVSRMLSALAAQVGPAQQPHLTELRSLFKNMQTLLPSLEPTPKPEANSASASASFQASAASSGAGLEVLFPVIHSRAQAQAAVMQVCLYLEKAEPTNPAQLLLKRACKLMDQPFLQLIKNLAPDALAEVARVMGINPDSLEQSDS